MPRCCRDGAGRPPFNALKVAGVCYLLYLAYNAITHTTSASLREVRYSQASLFVRGVLMNVLNPKVALFFLAFLPQFVRADAAAMWLQMVIYGVVFTLLVVVIFGGIGLFAGVLQRVFLKPSVLANGFRWIAVGMYVALAVRLTL